MLQLLIINHFSVKKNLFRDKKNGESKFLEKVWKISNDFPFSANNQC